MRKAALPFKIFAGLLAAAQCWVSPVYAGEIKKNETGLYRDVFDNNMYYEGVNYLHLDRLFRKLTGKKAPARDVNAFDEVPDNSLFNNRHARARLSSEALVQGADGGAEPDLSQGFTVTKGKFEGLHPGFWIRDSKGDQYILKFDSEDALELATGSEIIVSRFFHAIGYNVPPYTITHFDFEKASMDPAATTYGKSGFKTSFTMEQLQEYLIFIPQEDDGRYRASASKVLAGEKLGFFSFHGRRKSDPGDNIPHRERRDVRALQVFGSWLNVYDLRESNTLDVLVEDGKGGKSVKHYLIDFNDSLGSGASGAKPPMFTHEHMMDYGEAAKAYFTLGFWEKPWEKRWREAGAKTQESQALGYFDNNGFEASRYKVQLPHYAFKDVTRADGFWAAKIIKAFSDEDIRTLVKAGQLSNASDEDYLVKTLAERRDLIARYWFSQANPLDDFDLKGSKLVFKDLAVQYGFESSADTSYEAQISGLQNGKSAKADTVKSQEPSLELGTSASANLWIRTAREGRPVTRKSPYVYVEVRDGRISKIRHQD